VGQTVRPREDARDHHCFPALRNGNIMIGVASPDHEEAANEDNEHQPFRLESHEHPPDRKVSAPRHYIPRLGRIIRIYRRSEEPADDV
jgi:hypothetical protein